MEYWLTDGRTPQQALSGLRLVSLDPKTLRAEQVQGQWCVRDGRRVYFLFGNHAPQARQALEVIRHHGFRQIGYLGFPAPAMIVFLGAPGGFDPLPVTPPTPLSPGVGQAAAQGPFPARKEAAKPAAPPAASSPRPANNSVQVVLPNGRKLPLRDPAVLNQPVRSDRLAFDNRQLVMKLDMGDWKIKSGKDTLANFGPSLADAHRGLRVLQFYRCTEQCLVGQPKPTFSYFLANGQAPRGLMFGLRGETFRTGELTVGQLGGGWAIYDGNKPIIRAAGQLDDARKLLQLIRQQQCDCICRIGPDEGHGMTLLVRSR
jgi:hypothetical protein